MPEQRETDREKWNRLYAAGEYARRPSARLVELSHLLPHALPPPAGDTARAAPGDGARRLRALDLACGAGRNTLYLLDLGYEVDAWDVSDVGLGLLLAQVPPALRGRVRTRQVDLEGGPVEIPAGTYDLIVVVLYLHRPLLPKIRAAARPGGVVFYTSFYAAGPGLRHRPEHTLQPGELLDAFSGWDILHHREEPGHGIATLVARRPGPTAPPPPPGPPPAPAATGG